MNELLKKENWTLPDYEAYLSYLKSLEDVKYKEFHQKLTTTKYQILGISVPNQRKIAKQISKGNIESFLSLCGTSYYEEVMIEGFVIASIKDETLFWQYFYKFLSKIDNWAICDGFCNSLFIVKQNPHQYFESFLNLLKQPEDFTIRVGLITILSFYVEKEYLNQIFEAIDQITNDSYYVNMGMAWLLAELFIKYPTETETYFEKTKINDFTMNKTISKIRDSYRVTKKIKDELLKYKRNGKK